MAEYKGSKYVKTQGANISFGSPDKSQTNDKNVNKLVPVNMNISTNDQPCIKGQEINGRKYIGGGFRGSNTAGASSGGGTSLVSADGDVATTSTGG